MQKSAGTKSVIDKEQMNYKNFKQIPSKEVDVLILDEFGSEWVKECIPASASYTAIPFGASIPYLLSLKFIIKMIIIGIFTKYDRFISLFNSIIEELKPKAIISFNDNNELMGYFQKKYPKILVISIQNGVRVDDQNTIGGWGENVPIPHYYGFGEYEKELMEEKKVELTEYNAIGSLKLGLAMLNNQGDIKEKYDICFVSQFRSGKRPENRNQLKIHLDNQKELFDKVIEIFSKKGFIISVAMNYSEGSDYQKELNYFKKVIDCSQINFIPNDRTSFSSYQTGFSSKLIISMMSTFSFEMFGAGKRALFGGLITPVASEKRYRNKLFKHMPDEVLLRNLEPVHIKKKIDTLLNMSDEEYLETTSFARKYYMRCKPPYAHLVIKERIASHLKQ